MSYTAADLFHNLPRFHNDDFLDLEGVAKEIKKLSDEEAVIAYRAMKEAHATAPEQFANVADDIHDVLGLLKSHALRGGTFSPFATGSNAMRAAKENPAANILIKLGHVLADMFVFEEPTSLDVLRTECEKHSAEDRRYIAAQIANNPMTPLIIPEPLRTQVLATVLPE